MVLIKNDWLGIKLSKEDKAAIQNQAQGSGLSASDFILLMFAEYNKDYEKTNFFHKKRKLSNINKKADVKPD